MTITRIGTANMYDRTTLNISRQQAELASQMEHASAGKRVIRASDDPVAAAQAERARTRMQRIETDQRALDAQSATIKYAESTLGEINSAVQEFRGLLVQAGNGSYNQVQRDTLVEQLTSLRSQILTYSNRKDSNGLPLFRGLDTQSSTPFLNGKDGIQDGQTNSSEYAITNALDGAHAFFSGSTGNGVLAVERPDTNTGKAWADVGVIKNPTEASSLLDTLEVKFTVDANTQAITYQVLKNGVAQDLKDLDGQAFNPAQTVGNYQSEQAIYVQGIALTITGEPENGDSFTIANSKPQSIFEVLDSAIATVKSNGNLDGTTEHGALAHGIAKSLAEIDTQLNRVSTVRGVAGDLLNQAERMGTTLLARSEQLESQRSSAEDIDMVAALSQLKTQETAVSAALQSYASIQKLSLFNYIN